MIGVNAVPTAAVSCKHHSLNSREETRLDESGHLAQFCLVKRIRIQPDPATARRLVIEAAQQQNPTTKQLLKALALVFEGRSRELVRSELAIPRRTVSHWLRLFLREGMQCFENHAPHGSVSDQAVFETMATLQRSRGIKRITGALFARRLNENLPRPISPRTARRKIIKSQLVGLPKPS